ncbi:MAG: hypothetical protein KKB51_05615 [Candidatus Riflebacteria bacterium]|nr:hypothetical protein [Candidatus Riflebacteria bacterium]
MNPVISDRRKDELSLHMRIPADRCYLANALLTLDGICEHFNIEESARDRIKVALETALVGSIELSYLQAQGLFDLKFSVFKDKLQITVEDFMLNDQIALIEAPTEEQIREKLNPAVTLTDGFVLIKESGRNSCYSMQFNLAVVE